MDPALLVSFDMESKALVYCFICTFTSSVRLWVEATSSLAFNASKKSDVLPKGGHEEFIAVRNNVSG
jgi:hypothetical protein